MHLKKLFWIYTIILILLALLPVNGSGSVINHTYVVSIRLDYLIHCIIYLPWMYLLSKLTGINISHRFLRTLIIIFTAFMFSIINEVVQYYLPYRAFNINDLLANMLGIAMGFLFFFLVPNQLFRKKTT